MQLDSLGGIWLKKRVIDRPAPSRHAGNFNHRLLAARAHVSREFPERSLLFTIAAAQEFPRLRSRHWQERQGPPSHMRTNGTASPRSPPATAKLIGAVGEFR